MNVMMGQSSGRPQQSAMLDRGNISNPGSRKKQVRQMVAVYWTMRTRRSLVDLSAQSSNNTSIRRSISGSRKVVIKLNMIIAGGCVRLSVHVA